MKITLNGQNHDWEGGTVAMLVDKLVGQQAGVAVAVNGAVVPQSQWDREIEELDVVDVLTAVQGG